MVRRLSDPHVALAAGAAGVVLAEYLYRTRGHLYGLHPDARWLLVEAAVALAALGCAWVAQDRLRLPLVLGLTLAFQLVWIALHLHLHIASDPDPATVYGPEGNVLLHGRYPRSEYPPAAVLLFAFEKWMDPGHVATANRLLMVPFQLATVAAVWSLRTRYSAWLAAVVGLWPLNTYFWEFKYDLVPTALLAGALALALRERWGWAGLLLGIGTAAKWMPALAFAALVTWCLAHRKLEESRRLAVAFAAGLLVFYLPFVGWASSELAAAYTRQGGRSLTGESVWYLPLHAFEQTSRLVGIPLAAGAPRWADVLAGVVQGVLVLALIAAAAAVPRLPAAVALAALVPVLFLLTNRIFSAQYLVLMLAAWAIAIALLARNAREQGGLIALGLVATLANVFVFPFILWNRDKTWLTCSATLFLLALILTGSLVALALRPRRS